jgi:two-component system, NarL family, sensor histidine kinase UhpB
VHALEQMQQGRFDVALPRLRGTEAGAIGAAFNRMLAQLQSHIETERRAVRAELQLSDSRELTRWIDGQIEQERRAIARELHDELGQSVTAMRSMALSIAQRVAGQDAEAERAARIIADESSRLYDAMHGIIPRLTPLVLDNFGLAEALDGLLERTRRSQPNVQISQDVNLAAAPLPPDVALALFRAAQEGITNALRHGDPTRIALRVEGTPTHVSLVLQDDGRGLSATRPELDTTLTRAGHHGLRWLTERVQGLGGELRIEPSAPRGACLSVRIPLAGVSA